MPRTQMKDQRKQQLIDATIDSIAKRGLSETTITHISKGANLSRGIVNFYFTSKEKMMQAVLASLLEEYQSIWQQAMLKSSEGKAAKLQAIIQAHFDRRICAPKRLNVMSAFWGHAASHEAYRKQFDASDRAVQQAIADQWDKADADVFAAQLFALIRGFWLRYLLAPKQNDRAALAQEVEAFVASYGVPLKVVADNPQISKKPRAKKKAKAETTQMDIEDLFANG